jgi:hypothetical protein
MKPQMKARTQTAMNFAMRYQMKTDSTGAV